MRRSKILEKIRQGQVACICNASFTSSFRVVEMAAQMGYDGVWVDMEHRDLGYYEAAVMTLAARAGDMDTVVRIRKDSYADYFRPLEDGAAGIMIPHVKAAAEAQYAVYHAKYSPLGRRGIDGVGADTCYGLSGAGLAEANDETFVLLQVEDYEAVEAIDEIVAVEGVNGVMVGPADLAQSYGIPGELQHEKILAAMEKVARAVQRVGKWWGAPGLNPEFVRWLTGNGAQFIAYGDDYSALVKGLQSALAEFQLAVKREG